MILKSAQKIMAPYKIEYTYCDWWTAYQIGQRVGSKFSKNERIFLAGDAVHVSLVLFEFCFFCFLLTLLDTLAQGWPGYECQHARQ
jgi:hypothetical protein